MNSKKFAIIIFLLTGSIHSFATFYWSFGGEIGLLTVGQWTMDLKEKYGLLILCILFFLGLIKLSATWFPLILNYRKNKYLYMLSCTGATILILHGGSNTIVGWLKYLNIIQRQYTESEFGQAFIWDPLFFIWGIALFSFLRFQKNH